MISFYYKQLPDSSQPTPDKTTDTSGGDTNPDTPDWETGTTYDVDTDEKVAGVYVVSIIVDNGRTITDCYFEAYRGVTIKPNDETKHVDEDALNTVYFVSNYENSNKFSYLVGWIKLETQHYVYIRLYWNDVTKKWVKME